MNELQIFNNPEFGEIRIIEMDGEPWFVGKDVAEILGYANPSKALSDHVDAEDKLNNESLSSLNLNLGQRGGWIINESGLYSLVLSSKLPNAKKFKHWITHEVIPIIRKHGAYMTPDVIERTLTDPDYIIQLATTLKEERQKRRVLEAKAEENRPKVLFADSVAASNTSILVGELAKLLRQNGVDIGGTRLFRWMRENGYLIRRSGSDYNMPTQRSMEMGLFTIKETAITHADGTVNNMFRATTHSPTLETLGPICVFLGISIDQFLGMKPTEDSPPPETIEEIVNRELDVYRQEINGLNAQNELLREFVERQSRGIRNRDRLLRWMLVLLIFVVAYAVYLDLHCLEFGFFHG